MRLIVPISLLMHCGPVWALTPAQGDPLPVRLTVTGFDDAPVAGVEISIAPRDRSHDPDARRWGRTDENGRVEWAVPLEAGEDRLLVQITEYAEPGIGGAEIESRSAAFEQASEKYAIRMYYPIGVPPGATEIETALILEEGIVVSGRLLDSDGEPGFCMFLALPDMVFFPLVTSSDDGTFAVRRMPRGERVMLFFFIGPDNAAFKWWFALDPSQTMQDIDVGDIAPPQFPPPDAMLRVRLVANGYAWESEEPFAAVIAGVTLIPENVTNFMLPYAARDLSQPNYVVHRIPGPDRLLTRDLPLPAGTYYLAPNGLGNLLDPLIRGAYELVKSGAAAQVPGWPKVTIQAGQTLEIDFDPAAAANAIRSAMPVQP